MELGKTLYVKNRSEWRKWLSKYHSSEKVIWLIYYRKSSGKPRIPYNDAVEEALCFGWIDSTVKRIDDEKFAQRFTPRRLDSILSQMNRERVRKLLAEKQMMPIGLKAISHVFKVGEKDNFKIPKSVLTAIQKNPDAWKHFQKLPEHYKRIRISYILDRKYQGKEAFKNSLANFIRITAQGKRFGMVRD